MKTYDQIMATHKLYCQITNLDIPWDMRRYLHWQPFCNEFTDNDLCAVVKFLKEKQRTGKPARSLNFRSLIAGPESIMFFQEELAELKSRSRVVRSDPSRVSVLQATGRSEPEPDNLKSAAQIIAANVALAQLLQVRDSL